MINGIEGIPGSGKSYEAVAYHVLPALRSGRKVITNLPLAVEVFASVDPAYRALIEIRDSVQAVLGVWDASDIANTPAFRITEERPKRRRPGLSTDGKRVFFSGSERPASIFSGVWDYYTGWRDKGGRGPLFVIDECHVSLPRDETSREVVEWFKLHRHFNVDVLLITQSFRDIDQSIARLLGTLIRCRKADILGRKDSYIRKVHGGYRGAVIQTDERDYKPEYFRFYRSHTQGLSLEEAAAQDVKPFIVKFNRIKWVVVSAGVLAVVWAFWPDGKHNVFGMRKAPPIAQTVQQTGPRWVSPEEFRQARAVVPEPEEEPDTSRPLSGKQVHILGTFTMGGRTRVQFSVSDGGRRVFSVSDADLVDAGYTWRQMSDCLGWLSYGKHTQAVMCDAPNTGNGTSARPVVMDLKSGTRSDTVAGYSAR